MLLRRLVTVSLYAIVLLIVGLLSMRYLITRSITCLPDCVGANLIARDLRDLDLRASKLMEAQLQNADLSYAKLGEVDLSGANLVRVNLRNADLTDARLIGADLSGARLEGSILNRTDLSGAILNGADLTNVDLRTALVSGATFIEAKLTNVQLQGVDLSGLNFSKASLAGANFSRTKLAGASLSQADLSGALLVEADVTGAWLNLANLIGTNLTDADLSGSSLIGAKLTSANLQNSKFVGAILVGAHLDGANGRSADLSNALTLQEQLPAPLLTFLQGGQNLASQDLAMVNAIDPVLQELNQEARKPLLVNTDLQGVAFDSQTIWPVGSTIPLGSDSDEPLSLNIASENITTTQNATGGPVDESGLPVPRRVAVNFFINAIRNIRDQSSEYASDFYLDVYWQEPSIDEGQDITDLDPTTLWNPQLTLVNSLNGEYKYEVYDNSIEPDTNVRLSYRAIGDFIGNFDLHRFPFDQQQVLIALESRTSDSDSVVLEFIDSIAPLQRPDEPPSATASANEEADNQGTGALGPTFTQKIPKGRYIDDQALDAEWTLEKARVTQQMVLYAHNQSSRSRFQIELTIARKSAPYIWKYLAPLIALAVLAWSVSLLRDQDLVYRFWLLVLLIISLAIWHATMHQYLPHLPYMTYLDRFLLLHYGMLFGLVLWVVALKLLPPDRRPRLRHWLRRGLVVGYPIGYVGLNLLLYLR